VLSFASRRAFRVRAGVGACGQEGSMRNIDQTTRGRSAAAVAIVLSLGLAGPADAIGAIAYTGGVGDTVYGVAPYGVGPQAAPVFIPNNVTGFNDILASPGHGFLLASPVVANNTSQFGIAGLPLGSFQNGGGNGFGPFGSGATLITGPNIGFRLSDAFPAGGTASYSISSWTANFTVQPGGFAGNLGTYLAIGGVNAAFGSAAAASLVTDYYLNGIFQGQTAPLVLAAAGNGNFQALGGSGAIMLLGAGGGFRGLAIDNVPAVLAAGTHITAISTLTAFADPASIETFDLSPDLLNGIGVPLPDFAIASGSGVQVPEPATWALLLLGFFGIGPMLRRQRLRDRLATT